MIVFALGFDVAFLWQRAGGAYESEFGAHPDEAAHYVTGLFVRDAVTTIPEVVQSRSFAQMKAFGPDAPDGFYAHYPKVALGVWPPGFYVVQTAWTLPFGVSRTAILLLMAALASGVGVLIFHSLRREFGMLSGAIGSLLWLSAPLIRMHYGMVMAEMLCAFTMFAATIFWGRFLDARKTRDAALFGLFAAAAILTKGTGLALALMVVFSILVSRKLAILRDRGTWIGAMIVAIVAGPWTWYFRNAGTQVGGWSDNSGGFSLDFTLRAIPFYARHIVLATGIAIAVLAIIGVYARCVKSGENRGRWAAFASLVFGVYVFQCLIPVGDESRHIIAATPALVVLAFGGLEWLLLESRLLSVGSISTGKKRALLAALVVLLSMPVFAMTRVKKDTAGFAMLAEWIVANAPNSRVLVCSDAEGEGMFISEIAMRDARPGITVERGSKSLVDPKGRTWDGRNLKERFDAEGLMKYIGSGKIDFLVLDSAVPERRRVSYHDQVTRVVEDNQLEFWKVLESPITRAGEAMYRPLRLFSIRGKKNPNTP